MIELLSLYPNPKKLFSILKASRETQQWLRGWVMTRIVSSLLRTDFFDVAKNGLIPKEYAKQRKLDGDLLNSTCSYLYSLKILDKKNDRYLLSKYGAEILSFSKGLFILYNGGYEDPVHYFPDLLAKKKTYGKQVFRDSWAVAKGSGEVGKNITIPFVAGILNEIKGDKILDIGCGDGEFLITLCGRWGLAGYGIDISRKAVELAASRIEERKMGSRIRVFQRDAFDPKSFKNLNPDVITAFFVLHEFLNRGKKFVVNVLKKYKDVFPGRYLLLTEFCRLTEDQLRNNQKINLEYQFIHDLTNQGLGTEKEWKEIFKQAGITLINTKKLEMCNLYVFLLRL